MSRDIQEATSIDIFENVFRFRRLVPGAGQNKAELEKLSRARPPRCSARCRTLRSVSPLNSSSRTGIPPLMCGNPSLTPWHGVAMEAADGMCLMKRSKAEDLNASLVWRNNRPSHFVAPHLTVQEATS